MMGRLCMSNPGPFSDGWGSWPGQPKAQVATEHFQASKYKGAPRCVGQASSCYLPNLSLCLDSNWPSQQTLKFTLSLLARPAVSVCILPGNHDCYDAGSVYRKAQIPGNVTVFTETFREKVFPEINLTDYGTAILRKGT